MKYIEDCIILKNELVVEDIYAMELLSKYIVKKCTPGQFIQIKVSEGLGLDPLLRRPISINDIDKEKGIIKLYYKVIGKGTGIMKSLQDGQKLNVMGPLGNGFDINYEGKNIAIVGGGIGVAPLLYLSRIVSKKNNINLFLGFNDKPYMNEIREYCKKIYISSMKDEEVGYKGFITEVFIQFLTKNNIDLIYSCGPNPMLNEIIDISNKFNIPCQISLEERMACGFGACLGCSIETADGEMKKVCKDGPVFWCSEVKLNG